MRPSIGSKKITVSNIHTYLLVLLLICALWTVETDQSSNRRKTKNLKTIKNLNKRINRDKNQPFIKLINKTQPNITIVQGDDLNLIWEFLFPTEFILKYTLLYGEEEDGEQQLHEIGNKVFGEDDYEIDAKFKQKFELNVNLNKNGVTIYNVDSRMNKHKIFIKFDFFDRDIITYTKQEWLVDLVVEKKPSIACNLERIRQTDTFNISCSVNSYPKANIFYKILPEPNFHEKIEQSEFTDGYSKQDIIILFEKNKENKDNLLIEVIATNIIGGELTSDQAYIEIKSNRLDMLKKPTLLIVIIGTTIATTFVISIIMIIILKVKSVRKRKNKTYILDRVGQYSDGTINRTNMAKINKDTDLISYQVSIGSNV